MASIFRRGRAAKTEDVGTPTVSAWSKSDKAHLQRAINPLKNSFRFQPFGFLRAEATTMLCAPPSEIYDRLTSLLTNISVVSGLILSSIAGVALNPLDVNSIPSDKQILAEAYNVIGAVAVMTQFCCVLYSTFTLYIVISSAHNPTAIYRVVVHMSKWIGFLEFMTFIPPYLALCDICVAAHLYCKFTLSKWLICAVAAILGAVFQGAFAYMMSYALPYNAWAWMSLASPWMLTTPSIASRVKATGKVHGELLLAQAKEGVLGGLDENDDYVIDSQPTERAQASEAGLRAWVQNSLQHYSETKTNLLVKSMVAAGLTLDVLVETARHSGGFQAIVDMLGAEIGDMGLRPGDRLALAAGAMRAKET